MIVKAKKIILYSINGYSKKHDDLLKKLVDEKVLLFCSVGKDCELWHDVMDEFYVEYGQERDFLLITTWHTDDTIDEVMEFAKNFDIDGIDDKEVQIIQI